MTTRDVSVDQLRDENARLRRQLVRLRAANEELSEDNGHLRGSAICWRKLYEAALQSLGELRLRPDAPSSHTNLRASAPR